MMEKAIVKTEQGLYTKLLGLLAVCVLAAACLFCVPANAYAANSISVQYKAADTDKPVVGLDVYAFKVADVVNGEYVATDRLMGLYSDWPAPGSNAWTAEQLETIESIVRVNAGKPEGFATTNASGKATIGGLGDGLYIVLTDGDDVHTFVAALVDLSASSANLGSVTVEPKEETPANPVTEIEVLKRWAGDTGQESIRPKSVTVQLYCDGVPYGDPVELSDANGWKDKWTGLQDDPDAPKHTWNVLETSKADGYSMSIKRNTASKGFSFTVTNTKNPETPETPDKPYTPNTPNRTITGKLPQTGQLWWPVPVLLCAGIIGVGAGRIVSSRSRSK